MAQSDNYNKCKSDRYNIGHTTQPSVIYSKWGFSYHGRITGVMSASVA